MTAYDLDLYFFRRYKLKIRTGTQYTTHVLKKTIPNFTGKKCTKMDKKGKRESAGQDRVGTVN